MVNKETKMMFDACKVIGIIFDPPISARSDENMKDKDYSHVLTDLVRKDV